MIAMVMIVPHLVTMVKARSKGLVRFAISNDLSTSNVLLVESLNFNLLSVAQLCDLGFKCIFGVDDVEIISVDGSNLIFKGFRYEYNVSQSFWAKAINMACYCSNRLYCHPLKEKTPYELLNGRKPNIAYFWVFGCKCYILKKGTRLGKFDKKCDEGFLLGYSTTSKAYRVWNLDSGTLEEVHDVEFDETKGS